MTRTIRLETMDRYQTTIDTFDSVAEQYLHKFMDFELYQPSYDWFLQALQADQKSVLEVACGPGQVSHYLLQRQPSLEIMGIDLAPNMIKLAKQLNPQATYQVMDCREINQLDNRFDAVMCGFGLPYLKLKDALRLIKDMGNLLNDEGLLYLSTTAGDAKLSGYQSSKSSAGAIYVHYHDTENILSCLEEVGFSLLKHETITHLHNEQETMDEIILARKLT